MAKQAGIFPSKFPLGCIVLVWAHVSAFHAAADELPETDRTALGRGDIIVRSIENARNQRGVQAFFYVRASREKIWQTLVDYDNFPTIFDGIDKVAVLKRDITGARVEFWTSFMFKKVHFILDRQYTKPDYELSWTQNSGDLNGIEGRWQILDTMEQETKLLIYSSYIDIDIPVPAWILQYGGKRQTRKMAEKLRNWIEA